MMKRQTLADVCDVYAKAGADANQALVSALRDYAREQGIELKKSAGKPRLVFFNSGWGDITAHTIKERRHVRQTHG